MMNITEWTPDQWKKFGIGFFQVLLSFASFRLMQFAVRWYLFGRCTFRTFSYFGWRQDAAINDRQGATDIRSSQSLLVVPPNKKWRISNEAVSLIHSVVSGSWALYACLVYPQLLEDMVYFNNTFSHYLILLSTGYLLHDLIDLLINERSLRIMELLFHHVIVLVAFATTLSTGYFLGVVVCGLLMELNSIFLHSRSLLNLYGVPKMSTAFRIIALLNIITFMLFRMVVSACLIYWQITTAWAMFWGYTLVTFVVIISLAVTNTVLCYRVLAADGLLGAKRARRPPPVKVEEPDVVAAVSNTPNSQLVQPDDPIA